jgi:CRP-like cAMP-binding protein
MKLSAEAAILSNSPLFRGVDPAQLRLLALVAEKRVFHDGEELMHHGEEGHSAYVLIDGAAEVFVLVGGRETPVAFLSGNEIVGEMALLTDLPRTATVRARGRVEALRIDRETLLRLLREFPGMALELLRVMTKRLERTTRELGQARADLEALRRGS